MESILTTVEGIARFISVLGASLSVVFFAYSGILFMTAQGDPQKTAQARNAFLGVVVGLSVVGLAFLVPEVITRNIIVPAGGYEVRTGVSSSDCDGLLKQQLVVQRGAGNKGRINQVVQYVQGSFDACGRDVWNPLAVDDPVVADSCGTGGSPGDLPVLGSLFFPPGLAVHDGSFQPTGRVKAETMRDAANNVLVLWSATPGREPWEGSTCWVYFGRFDTWRSG